LVYEFVLAPIGRGVAAVARGIGSACRWLYDAGLKPIGRVIGRGLYYLAQPFVLLGRGLWYVLKLLGRWIAGLFRVVVQAFVFAAEVGRKVGRGVVWLWQRTLWIPIRFVALGLWDAAKAVGRGLRTVLSPVARGLAATRNWYRREISQPVRGALRAARRDIRRALFGRDRT